MQLGAFVAYWPWFTYDEQVALARQADRLGYDSVWVAEGYGQEAVAILGALSAVTERIRLGSGILQIPARQPAAAATAAATLDRISGGRLLLGLGLSGPQVSEGWYGVPFTSPLRRTREYIEIIRAACSGERLSYAGQEWTIPTQDGLGLGKPLKMLGGGPVQDRIPIYLGVTGPKTVEQCGEIADGWFPFLLSPEHAEMVTAPLLRGLERAGRDRSAMTIAAAVPVAVDADVRVARDLVRPLLAFYLGGMGSKERNFYAELAVRYGHGASARECQDRFLAGDRRGAGAALTDDLIDLVAIAATPATLEKKVARFADAGVDTLVVVPFGDRPAVLDTLAQVMA
ncbi:LLM class flavin-dependent oxidoreductase [Pseudonocardia broussonetiae]|uniref:LLM class flavin-dependent oxidoreductase n=1 Tax=Pseudonocardia broussonetiae TaxID=2736640 RepID=A0A6M6JTN6_9PSEU|nr:LLM class flavin-dependent oxidoreductase [Pseudonocardia broussonetiae]QJY49922.1 LLM class flavin-dependent oxidoreductase [Pseudonocardia broussonetiae]